MTTAGLHSLIGVALCLFLCSQYIFGCSVPDVDKSAERRILYQNGLGKTPPMGWNDFNHFNNKINEQIVRETADALISTGLAAAGYNYVNIDDLWAEKTRDAEDKLVARKDVFPSGIKALADYVHSKGLKFGIYSDAGYLTCAKQPGSLGKEVQDANTFASWGVDFLKYDNCHTDGTSARTRYAVMRDALRATGRPIFFAMCEWGKEKVPTWAAEVGNSWRTTGDIKDHWESMIARTDQNEKWAKYAGPGGWNDPDMLEVGNGGMSLEEYRTHFSLWALMKSPLIIGCDVRNISKDYLDILSNREVISVNQDSMGVQGKKVRKSGDSEVWAGPLSNSRYVALLLNRGESTVKIKATWEEIGVPGNSSSSLLVRDIWKAQSWNGSYIEANVESHAVNMFILSPLV